MTGVIQRPLRIVDEEIEVPDEVDAVELALAMCPPGMAIEIHAAACAIEPCTCLPRIIEKPHPS